MENNKTEITIGGGSLLSSLFIVFFVLKLTGVISWSWWWVTAPLWGGIALILGIALFALVVYGLIVLVGAIITFFDELKNKQN